MPRRKTPYRDKPYKVSEDARRRFEALMEPLEPREANEKKAVEKWEPKGGWQLWRWDTLEDVLFD